MTKTIENFVKTYLEDDLQFQLASAYAGSNTSYVVAEELTDYVKHVLSDERTALALNDASVLNEDLINSQELQEKLIRGSNATPEFDAVAEQQGYFWIDEIDAWLVLA